ncbi:MAG TPA: hypothetical protein VN578_02560 [Candidatus Binatia bacterium]|jgi:hypothetical protein|nr:hypothetical protein [Candidatus Binatia bacterium]
MAGNGTDRGNGGPPPAFFQIGMVLSGGSFGAVPVTIFLDVLAAFNPLTPGTNCCIMATSAITGTVRYQAQMFYTSTCAYQTVLCTLKEASGQLHSPVLIAAGNDGPNSSNFNSGTGTFDIITGVNPITLVPYRNWLRFEFDLVDETHKALTFSLNFSGGNLGPYGPDPSTWMLWNMIPIFQPDLPNSSIVTGGGCVSYPKDVSVSLFQTSGLPCYTEAGAGQILVGIRNRGIGGEFSGIATTGCSPLAFDEQFSGGGSSCTEEALFFFAAALSGTPPSVTFIVDLQVGADTVPNIIMTLPT